MYFIVLVLVVVKFANVIVIFILNAKAIVIFNRKCELIFNFARENINSQRKFMTTVISYC